MEEDVKAAYRKFFSLPQDSSKHLDLYTPQILFEFEFNKDFGKNHIKAEVLAQILYYVHRLKFEFNTKPIPSFLCLADVNEMILTETIQWENFYNNIEYDWDAAPSSPDIKLISDLEKAETLIAGRYQIIHSLENSQIGGDEIKNLEIVNNKLGEKIRSRIHELGFLR